MHVKVLVPVHVLDNVWVSYSKHMGNVAQGGVCGHIQEDEMETTMYYNKVHYIVWHI